MHAHRRTMISGLSALFLATIACNASGRPTTTAPAAVSPTPLSLTTEATASTSSSPTPISPTVTPGTPPESKPQRITFDTGAISATMQGVLTENGISAYLLYALEGQTMTVTVTPTGGRAALTIASPGGTPLVRAAMGQTQWSGQLPESGDYTIAVEWLEGSSTTYTLDVDIPPLSTSKPSTCQVTNQENLTAYKESSLTAEVFGTAEDGTTVMALSITKDGWLGFDPGVAQAGNEDRARLRWYRPDWSKLIFNPTGCEKNLPYLLSYESITGGTYNVLGLGTIKLTNGSYTNAAFDPANPKSTVHDTHMSMVAFGDMNNDGTEDAVVSLGTNTGGSGMFVELALVLNIGGQPQHVISASLGDRIPVRALHIDNGLLTADLTIHDADDPLCCPSLDVTEYFKYQDKNLVEVNK